MKNLKNIGMWKPEVASDPFKSSQINVTSAEISNDQLIQLYIQLYPFIASEFLHRSDLQNWAKTFTKEFQNKLDIFNKKMDIQNSLLSKHFHITPNGPSDSSSMLIDLKLPNLDKWSALPEDKDFKEGENLITDNSTYSKAFLHRNPTVSVKNSNPKLNIVQIFKVAKKLIPFA